MPSLTEIKEMLVKAEQEAEHKIEELFTTDEETKAPEAAPVVAEPIRAGEVIFNTEKAYGHVDGIAGVRYQQDGVYFDSKFKFVRKE